MSLLPLIFRDMLSISRPLRMLENHIRLTDELLQPFVTPIIRIQKYPIVQLDEEPENIIHDKEKFQIKLDLQHFAPEEISVKTMDGNSIQIEARHEKDEKEGFISRQLIRKFILPKDHNLEDVVSSLSSDGILTVTAPRKLDATVQERMIKINHTGPERATENKKSEDSVKDFVEAK